MNGDSGSVDDDDAAGLPTLWMIVGQFRYLIWTIGIVFVVGFVCAWVGYWVASDYQRPFDEVLGTVLVSVADGLFLGLGLLGVVGAVMLVREASERR